MTERQLRQERVVRYYEEGESVQDIAKRLGLTTDTINDYLREHRMADAENARALLRQAILKDHANGMSAMTIAIKHNVSYPTVLDTIRQDKAKIAPDLLYKQLTCPAVHKRYIREWAKTLPGKTIRTPEGKMTVTKAYPHFVECAVPINDTIRVTTFLNGEVYYLNHGGTGYENNVEG